MLNDLFVEQIPITEKIVRTLAVYLLIVVLFRVTGKRGLAGLNTFDVVVIFLLSNVVQNAIIGNDQSLLGGVIGAATLVLANTLVNRLLVISPRAERVLQGRASTVITDGTVDQRAARRLGLRRSELEHAVRVQNGDSVADVARGRLEPDGQLVLDLKAGQQGLTRDDLDTLLRRFDALERTLTRQTDTPASG